MHERAMDLVLGPVLGELHGKIGRKSMLWNSDGLTLELGALTLVPQQSLRGCIDRAVDLDLQSGSADDVLGFQILALVEETRDCSMDSKRHQHRSPPRGAACIRHPGGRGLATSGGGSS